MQEYLKIESELRTNYNFLKKRKNILSNIRLVFFLLTILTFYFYFSTFNFLYLLGGLFFLVIFIILVAKSANVIKQFNFIKQALITIESIKQEDIADEYSAINKEYFNNIYNNDLDILEGKSLFNRINKTQSFVGNYQLKYFLSNLLLNREDIFLRQNAFKELSLKPNFIINFLTFSKLVALPQFKIFKNINRQFEKKIYLLFPIIFTVINFCFFVYLAINYFPKKEVFFWLIIAIPLGVITNFLFNRKINTSLSFAFIKTEQLENLIELFALVENENFEEVLNFNVKNNLKNDNETASQQLKKVKSSFESLDAIGFPIVGFLLNNFTLWKLFFTIQLEGRVEKVVKNNENWIKNIALLEAYISFAIFNDKNENFTKPIISDNSFELNLENAYHPLLTKEEAVKNNFSTNRPNNISIITGANMAGKSTFLRTIGTNLVLAMNGANISAEKMIFYPMQLFTSIRTVDNLSSGDSYFKNEINKLKILIDNLDNGIPQYIILDEILKGTNSQDKLIGSKRFLEKLINNKTNLVCFIATHDLELTSMEEEYPNHIINYCFELKNIDDNYFSDYKLRKGTTKVMNAIYLMKEFKIID